ncbi:ompA family protein, partial [Vibrio parahaemolyticus VPTS-2010_2]
MSKAAAETVVFTSKRYRSAFS